MQNRSCRTCEKPFQPARYSHGQVYCSRPCQLVAAQKARSNKKLGPRPCELCGRAFKPKQMSSAARFCSRACLHAGMRGEKAANWKGGRHVRADGYAKVYMPDHASADHMGYVLEHRLVMEQRLGRPLRREETVHHINGDRLDNAADNLQLRQGRHGKGCAMMCGDCGSVNVVPVTLAGPTGGTAGS